MANYLVGVPLTQEFAMTNDVCLHNMQHSIATVGVGVGVVECGFVCVIYRASMLV